MDARLDDLTERLAAVVPAAAKLRREEIEDLVKAIEALHLVRPNPDQLWTLRRIALYTGLDDVILGRLLKAPDAPQPIVGDRAKAWRARDVFAWIDRQSRPSLRVVK
jgi:predicted DNA-binding transcriptional regulator AlpA